MKRDKNDNINKAKFKKLDNQTNIDKYHIISKLIFLRIIKPKFMMTKQLFI